MPQALYKKFNMSLKFKRVIIQLKKNCHKY